MGEDERDYRLFLKGGQEGFERLVLRYKDNLICFLQRYVKDFHNAEDLAQDVFVEVLLHKERYHFKTGFKTYIFTIGRNKAVDFIRRNGRLLPLEELPERGPEAALLESVIKEEDKRELLTAIARMREDYQRAVYLVDLEELSYSEAAAVLGKTLPQMKILIYRARKALKRELEKGGYRYDA